MTSTDPSTGGAQSVDPSDARREPEFLIVGKVAKAHGLSGALLVIPLTDGFHNIKPDQTVFLGPDYASAVVRDLRTYGNRYRMWLEGCDDLESTEQWIGCEVRIRFEDAEPLPEHVYYQWQILGLEVVTERGEVLGRVEEILETGANDVYLVRDRDQGEILLPAIEPVVLEVDLEAGRMVVRVMPGLRPDPRS